MNNLLLLSTRLPELLRENDFIYLFIFLKSRFAPRLDKTSNNEDVTFPAVASQTKLLTLQKNK